MTKSVTPYKQRGNTCAIVCLMIALEYYGKIEKANWYDERKLYKQYASRYIVGTPFSAIAYILSKKGLNTKMYHSEKDFFTNKNKVFNDVDFNLVINEYKEYIELAKKLGTNIINGIDINIELIKKELDNDKLIILAGEINGFFHAILIAEKDNDIYVVCDPLYKKKQEKTGYDLEQFMNTRIGKWFISVDNK
ncbi:MAG: hypothetical protein IJD92_01320 [Bacilli bacterium]|nr:hypothetical protein [Bacilli bacterium]